MKLLRLTYGLLGLLQGGYFALWLPKLQARGFSLSQIAMLFSVEIAVTTILNLPLGKMADEHGHKRITIVGFATYLIAVLIPSISASAMALALGIILIGVGNAFVSGALESWASDIQAFHVGNMEAQHFIDRDQIQRIGVILGSLGIPFIVSFILNEAPRGTWAVFAVVGITLLGVGLMTPEGRIVEKRPENSDSVLQTVRSLLRRPGFIALTLAWVTFGLCTGAVDLSFYPRLTQEFQLSDSWIFGVIQASVSLSRLGGSEIWKRTRWINSYWVPGVSVLASSIFFLGYGIIGSPTLAVCSWLIRVAVMSAYFSTIISSIVSTPEFKQSRATVLSLSAVAAACGEFILTTTLAAWPMQPMQVALLGGLFSIFSGLFLLYGASKLRQTKGQPLRETL